MQPQWKSLADPGGAVAGHWEVTLPFTRAQGTSKCHNMAKLVGDANHEGPSPPATTQSDRICIEILTGNCTITRSYPFNSEYILGANLLFM